MTESGKAVFLSYASQDAEAAKRICEALRQAGVEVWFDQSELRGGDSWDAMIRKRIKECALFVPIISANTQARTEGYFRLEWRLADQRTHLMAKGRPFLLPVVIDATQDADAHVPDSFTEVQWTRLPGGDTPAAFCAQVHKLLRGGGPPARGQDRPTAGSTAAARRFHPGWLFVLIPVAVFLLSFGGMVVKRFKDGKAPTQSGPPEAGVAETSQARQLAEQARRHFTGIFTRADLALAEELGRRATELEPTLARAWAVRAGAEACHLMRGFVAGEAAQRRADNAQTFANRALALDRNEPEALIALGQVAMFQQSPAQAEAFYRRVMSLEPDNPFARRYLSIVLRNTGRVPEAIAVMEEAVRRYPGDVLTRFDLAVAYAYGWDWARAWDETERALALQPFPGAQMLKVRLAFQWKGDVAQMRRLLDEVDVTYRGEDDAVLWDMRCGMFERRPDRVIQAAGRTARNYLEESFIFPGPKAWFTARAHQLAGREGLARQEWLAAEAVVRARLEADPRNLDLRLKLAVTLAWLQRQGEADQELKAIELAWREQLNPDRAWDLASYHAACGDAAAAVQLLRQALHAGTGIAPLTVHHLRLDPWWDLIRGSPEFQALLADPPPLPPPMRPAAIDPGTATPAPTSPGEGKSVAVLAFANLSDDAANEYFSDGISEELLNVLAKVPGLKVTARTSAFHFKGKDTSIPEIARQLGVAYVVEGSVRKQGDRVRISAQLIKAADGFHVWSDTFTRDLQDIFAVQDEISGLIAKSLSLELGAGSGAAVAGINPEAYRLYLEGRNAWRLRTLEGYAQAERLFERVLALEPAFALAHAGLADVELTRAQDETTIGRFDQRAAPSLKKADAATRRALDLDPRLAEAHAARGTMHWMEWRFDEAARALRLAVALNPNYASAHQWLGRVLMADGRLAEALVAMQRAHELDPLAPRIADNYCMTLIDAQRYDEALVMADRALALQPDSVQAIAHKAVALAELGRSGEAIATARQWRQSGNNGYRIAAFSYAFARAGAADEAKQILDGVSTADRRLPNGAATLLALGRREESLAEFETPAVTAQSVEWLYFWPVFDQVRSDPRFQKALAALGVADAHVRAQAWRAANPPKNPEPGE